MTLMQGRKKYDSNCSFTAADFIVLYCWGVVSMKSLYNRVEKAVKQDPSLVVLNTQVDQYLGFPISHYKALGLHKSDLKRLERGGLAVRGYLPRKPVYSFPKGVKTMTKHSGFEVRYILVRYE